VKQRCSTIVFERSEQPRKLLILNNKKTQKYSLDFSGKGRKVRRRANYGTNFEKMEARVNL